MARQPRKVAKEGIYHVLLIGIKKQVLFEDEHDYRQFMNILQRQALTQQVKSARQPHCILYAYCLMPNHVHLLVKERDEPVGATVKRIVSAYVYYYNRKNNRMGSFFQGRFKSQPVDDPYVFVSLLSFIHQNPVKAKLVKKAENYEWSGWPEYLGNRETALCDIASVLKLVSLSDLRMMTDEPMSAGEERGLLEMDTK